MNKTKSLILISLIIFISFIYTTAKAVVVKEKRKNSVVIEDVLGNIVEVKLPVKKIIALNSDVLEIIRALNAKELVTAVYSEIDREPVFWKDFSDRPRVGSWRKVNMEKVAELAPDLIIAYERSPGRELEKKIKPLGIQVLRLNFYKINSMVEEIKALGIILDREKEAETLCAWYEDNYKKIRERLNKIQDRPSVYLESYSQFRSSGPGSGANEMCRLAGGKNIASDFSILG